MKANKPERILSVAAAILFCLTLVLYAFFRIDPFWPPYNLTGKRLEDIRRQLAERREEMLAQMVQTEEET